MNDQSRFRYLLCDLDDTLYPASAGVMRVVGQLILRYMAERVGIPQERVEQIKKEYYQRYGTTMRGLILHYGIDPDDYLAFVHDLPVHEYIQPNPALDAMLAGISLRKAVFTNADRDHACRVLNALGVPHHFEWIIDVRDFGYNSKPHPIAYSRMLDILNASAGECIMVEDIPHNLTPAKALGMATVLISDDPCQDGADICIPDILQLGEAIRPWITS